MDIKNIVSIDDENIWKSDHTSNPYAIVLNAKKYGNSQNTSGLKNTNFILK